MLKKGTYRYLFVIVSLYPLENGFSPPEVMLGRKLRTSQRVIPMEFVRKLPDLREEADQIAQHNRRYCIEHKRCPT